MFLRTKVVKQSGKAYEYVQLVENFRDEDGITRQRVLKSLGSKDSLRVEEIETLVASLERFMGKRLSRRRDCEEVTKSEDAFDVLASRRFGDVYVLRELWRELGLHQIFDELADHREFKFDLGKALFTMVANRAIDPRSKLDTIEWANLDVLMPEVEGLDEHHLYRTLTWLDDVKVQAETQIFERVVRPRSEELRLVLYDTSPAHFETNDGPPLAQHGRRSRAPHGKKIVLVALVTTFDGWPIFHQVFPGSTADVKTVESALLALRDRFKVGRVLFLSDNGMVSSTTLALLERLGFDFMVAVKLKTGTKEVRDQVLGRAGRYREVDPNLRVKEVTIDQRRYVVCHNPDEDRRDKARRESMLAKLAAKLDGGVLWDSQKGAKIRANAAYRRYVARGRGPTKGQVVISKTRVERDERYDGKWVVYTSRADLRPEDVACLYKSEGAIEHDWRDLKSVLGLRPIRHFTDHNVRGHIFVCVLAKILLREIQRRLDQTFAPVGSPPTVIENLGRIPAVQVETPRGTLWKTARLTPQDTALLRALRFDPAVFPRAAEGPSVMMPTRFSAPASVSAANPPS
jgi:transposase